MLRSADSWGLNMVVWLGRVVGGQSLLPGSVLQNTSGTNHLEGVDQAEICKAKNSRIGISAAAW